MGGSILPTLVRCSLDGKAARRAPLRSLHPRDAHPQNGGNRSPPPATFGLDGGPDRRPPAADENVSVQGLHAGGRADQPDRPHRRDRGPPPRPPPHLWLAPGRALDARRRRPDRERLRAGGQDRSDRDPLTGFHTFLTAIPLFCRHLPITVFRLDALHHLLGAPPKGARGAA